MAGQPPQYLTLKHNRDAPNRVERVLRWTLVASVTLLLVLALVGVLGQETVRSAVTEGHATLEVEAPTRLRGGLFYQGRFTVAAGARDIDSATVVLEEGWLENMHINTIEPAPVGESSRNGRLALDLGHVPAGERLVLYMQFQVNPTNVGRRSQDVALYDGETLLTGVDRTVTVFP